MKKRNLIAVLMMTAALAAGCGAKAETTTAAPTQAETTKAETTQAETTQSETTQSESQKTEEKTESVTGKIEEIKDFMFTIESDKGTYAMTFDTAPEGLSDVKEGDEVTVTYTGELSEVDAFTGTIISVEKANSCDEKTLKFITGCQEYS